MLLRNLAFTLPFTLLGGTLSAVALAQPPTLEVRSFSGGETFKADEGNGLPNKPAAMDEHNKKMWDMLQTIQRLELQMQVLTGKLEQQENVSKLLQHDLNNRYNDLDQRIASTEVKLTPSETTDSPVISEAVQPVASTPVAEAAPALTTPTNVLATPTVPAVASATATTTPVVPKQPAVVSKATGVANENAAYQKAYEAYKNGGASKAIEPMQYFIDTYPNSAYFPNANYWQGEFYLQLTPVQLDKANAYFNTVYTKFAQHSKASAALLRSANIADIQQNPSQAKKLMQQLVQQYPSSEEATQAKTYLAK